MQEEIEQKSFNIMISTTKLSARTVLNAVKAAIRLYQSKASQGKQSVRTLLRQNRGVSSVEISKTGIKGFERYAKKYGIDYAIRKDSSEVPPKYLVFFKAPDAEAIDTALAERPADLDEFLNLMKRAGYEVKTVRGGGISFRLTGQGQERFTRLRASTLGDGYDLQDVLSAIEGKEKRPGRSERKISLAVDIQAKLAAGKGPGYERWAKVFNIKQMAAALAYIQDNGLTDYEQLAQKATEAADRFHAISEQIKQTEQAMKTNAGLKAATVQYAKTRPVFEQYKATKYSRKFLAEHEADLELYRAAQAEMRSLLGGAKLPKMDVLKEEGRKLTAKKKQLYGEYQKARRDMQEIVTIKANIDTLMGYTEPGRKQEKER